MNMNYSDLLESFENELKKVGDSLFRREARKNKIKNLFKSYDRINEKV